MQLSIALEALSGTTIGTWTIGGTPAARGGAGGPRGDASQRGKRQKLQEVPTRALAKHAFDAYLRAADIADIRARKLLNIAEAESRGAYTLARIATANREIVDTYESNRCLTDRNVTQAELLAGMASGRYAESDQLGPIDGYRALDNGAVEATHAVVKELDVLLLITQTQWDEFAANHVPGFPRGALIGSSFTVPGRVFARANQQRTMVQLARLRQEDVADMLRKSRDPKAQALADLVPDLRSLLSDPKTGAGLTAALGRFQTYAAESNRSQQGRDLYESLAAMAQPLRPDAKDKGRFVANPDAALAQQIAQACGGWHVLEAYHDEVVLEQIFHES